MLEIRLKPEQIKTTSPIIDLLNATKEELLENNSIDINSIKTQIQNDLLLSAWRRFLPQNLKKLVEEFSQLIIWDLNKENLEKLISISATIYNHYRFWNTTYNWSMSWWDVICETNWGKIKRLLIELKVHIK